MTSVSQHRHAKYPGAVGFGRSRKVPRLLGARALLVAACWLITADPGRLFAAESTPALRQFIAHRGVNLNRTIAGENSLEAIGYTHRAGFATIETDVRLTADGQLVIMHDETLNRTCLTADGTALKEAVPVSGVTLAELRANYILKADQPEARTRVPTLREYLEECRRQNLLPFIEPKLNDPGGAHYRDIIAAADAALGRGHYIITSNNRANRVIRGLGIQDVRVMSILYQTTFEDIAGLGNAIMAISATRFTRAEFSAHVARAVAAGIPIESHGDNFAQFSLINAHPVDFVSTDELAPDLAPGARLLVACTELEAFQTTGRKEAGGLRLAAGETLRPELNLPNVAFGGIYLEMEVAGSGAVRLGHQQFTFDEPRGTTLRHQLLVYAAAPVFALKARGECAVKRLSLKLVSF
jgi:glycerophosphoryl diester phosphodiesterase